MRVSHLGLCARQRATQRVHSRRQRLGFDSSRLSLESQFFSQRRHLAPTARRSRARLEHNHHLLHARVHSSLERLPLDRRVVRGRVRRIRIRLPRHPPHARLLLPRLLHRLPLSTHALHALSQPFDRLSHRLAVFILGIFRALDEFRQRRRSMIRPLHRVLHRPQSSLERVIGRESFARRLRRRARATEPRARVHRDRCARR